MNGESQSVKPGDSLLDGSKVLSIQTNSVTIRSADGATTSVPLTSGSGGGDQSQNGQNGQDQNGGGQPFGEPQQPFNGPPQPMPFGGN